MNPKDGNLDTHECLTANFLRSPSDNLFHVEDMAGSPRSVMGYSDASIAGGQHAIANSSVDSVISGWMNQMIFHWKMRRVEAMLRRVEDY